MKGIILAGGAGTRLYPASLPISKILLSVYDKPMIYYPLSTLMLAGIKDILIITNPADYSNFVKLLGDGKQFGINISYEVQHIQRGIADAFLIGEKFINGDNVALILGDNIFHGYGFQTMLKNVKKRKTGATVFGYTVKDPERFGVVEFDKDKRAISLEEKPKKPKSNYAVTGLYFYDNKVVDYAKTLKPSDRGELEITDLNKIYLQEGALNVEILGRGFTWLDTGTHDSVLQASNFIQSMELNKGEKISCLEEIAFAQGFLTKEGILCIY
jgi:glucose-1-phosphate thymidylyltransferase